MAEATLLASNDKVCVIGLDGGTFDVLDKWVEAGEMPHLAGLMQRGARANLMSTVPTLTVPAWTSMTTGVNPGRHGAYDFVKWPADGGPSRFVRSWDVTVPRFWDLAGDGGRRVGAFHVPVTYPVWPVNGFMMSGILTPRPSPEMIYPHDLFRSLPRAELRWHLLRDLRPDRLHIAWQKVRQIQRAQRVLRRLLNKYEPELFMYVSSEVDHMQHVLWGYCMRDESAADPRIRSVVRRFFRTVDDTIGLLRDHFGDGATYHVVSDHGFGPWLEHPHFARHLVRQGFLKIRPDVFRRTGRVRRLVRKLSVLLKELGLFEPARRLLRTIEGAVGVRLREVTGRGSPLSSAVDWQHTRAFVRSATESGVRLNVLGRERQGTVEPGRQYEEVLRQVTQLLEDLTDPETGERLMERVVRPEEIHHGPYMGDGPDLFVVFREDVGRVREAPHRPVSSTVDLFTGHHRRAGVLVAAGPGIKAGPYQAADILDVAPMVLHSAGLAVPRYMEGQVLAPMFEPGYLEDHPVRYSDAPLEPEKPRSAKPGAAEGDDKDLRRRLRDLGYV